MGRAVPPTGMSKEVRSDVPFRVQDLAIRGKRLSKNPQLPDMPQRTAISICGHMPKTLFECLYDLHMMMIEKISCCVIHLRNRQLKVHFRLN